MTGDPDYIEAVTPTAVQVAQRVWARTKEHGGQTWGEFNENTRPTRGEVEAFIVGSVVEVTSHCPALAAERWGLAREAAVIRTSMKIELAYRPEQANESESAYYLLRQDWLDLLGGGPGGQRGSRCGTDGDGVEAGASTRSAATASRPPVTWRIAVAYTGPNCGVRPKVRVLEQLAIPPYVNDSEPVCEELRGSGALDHGRRRGMTRRAPD